jgi:outer membrane protein assembly factor BamB
LDAVSAHKARFSSEPARSTINADDVVVCLDADNGATVWKAVFDGGVRDMGKRSGPLATPCIAGGRCYVLRSTGMATCLDLKDGRVVWEQPLGSVADTIRQRLDGVREIRRLNRRHVGGVTFNSCPTIAGGMAVYNNHQGGLIGYDALTGMKKWTVRGTGNAHCNPMRWVHAGKEYILANRTLVDPRTGKVLWRAKEAVMQGAGPTPTIWRDYVVYSGGSVGSKDDKRYVGLNCFKMSLTEAKKVWCLEGREFVPDAHKTPLIHEGFCYSFVKGRGSDTTQLICVEVKTGKIVARLRAGTIGSGSSSSLIAADGRLITTGAKDHLFLLSANAANMKLLHGDWPAPSNANSITQAIANGRLFIRGKHSMLCYDLRVRTEQ